MDLSNYKSPLERQKLPRHEQAAKVNEIIKIVGEKNRPYGFWLKYVKKFSFGDILEICKTANELPEKYSKGGYVMNRLLRRKKKL